MASLTEDEQPEGWTPWHDVDAAISEIEWFASRKKDLAAKPDVGNRATWAEVLQADIDDLRQAIRDARGIS